MLRDQRNPQLVTIGAEPSPFAVPRARVPSPAVWLMVRAHFRFGTGGSGTVTARGFRAQLSILGPVALIEGHPVILLSAARTFTSSAAVPPVTASSMLRSARSVLFAVGRSW